jgi:hypothetical protein
MVWVNLSSKIYHKEGKFYGKTKRGKFMSEDDAKKAGYREAKTETSTKTKSKTADTKPVAVEIVSGSVSSRSLTSSEMTDHLLGCHSEQKRGIFLGAGSVVYSK